MLSLLALLVQKYKHLRSKRSAAAFTDYKVFLIGTSFIHYCRYITTYYHRENVSYGNFKRDVLIYKSIALAQLFALYVAAVTQNLSSMSALLSIPALDLAMVVGGYALSMYATAQLGVDGTYFGIELGFVKASKNYVQASFRLTLLALLVLIVQKYKY